MAEFYSSDPQMLNTLELAKNVAASKATILLTGESGVGKEQLSKFIHAVSNRSQKPFIAINCAALPENLLESELFGYDRGAFTGANSNKMGKIEAANGGTFLLDEVSELPLALQGKLLRVIQEKEIQRLGSNKTLKVDVRFICTTNKNLKDMVREKSFRNDLFYRINVVPMTIPSLKERPSDIPFYAEKFMTSYCKENDLMNLQLSTDAVKKLQAWHWPGNVRELANVIERSILISKEQVISAENVVIDGFIESRRKKFGPGMTVSEAEKMLIEKTLVFTNNNKTQASRLLGISIRTLRNKLNEYKREAV